LSVAKSSFLFAAGTLLSRLSGLARDMVVVGVFGASHLLDAFFVAFRIPNLLREMLAEGALGSSFTKVYSSLKEDDPPRAYRLLIQSLLLFTVISCFVCGLGILFSADLVGLMTLQVDVASKPELITNAVGLTRILFPYLGLMIISSIVMGALHEKGSFFLSAFSPVAFNFGFIFGAWLLASWFEAWNPPWMQAYFAEPTIVGLAVGVLLGGIAQFVMQLSRLLREMAAELHSIGWRLPWNEDIKKVVQLMIPASIAAGAGPINVFVNTNFATALGEGAVSWLNFAFRLLQLPIGLFGVAVGVAVLPTLSRSLQRSQQVVTREVSHHLQQAVELVGWLMIMCLVYLVVNHQAMIELLYQHGHFTEADKVATSDALLAYSFGVLGYGLIKVLTAFYYAVERTDFAMKVSLFSILVNFLGNYLLVQRFGHVGLALTSALTLSINAIILSWGLKRFDVRFVAGRFWRSLLWLLAAGAVAVGVMLVARNIMAGWLTFGPLKLQAAIALAINGGLLVLIFAAAAMAYLRLSPTQLLRQGKSLLRRPPASGGE
jgi:putative peptidoglycan lipid II flippase